MSATHSDLLQKYAAEIAEVSNSGPILDLACGTGRNGLFLIRQNTPVVFADVNRAALDQIKEQLQAPEFATLAVRPKLWQVDFETQPELTLKSSSYAGIIVFRYLHRPLMPELKQAVKPGGLVIYETFTVAQSRFGRPKNPDFLLQEGELDTHFSRWKILHTFEGIIDDYASGQPAAIAQIVARKPD